MGAAEQDLFRKLFDLWEDICELFGFDRNDQDELKEELDNNNEVIRALLKAINDLLAEIEFLKRQLRNNS